MRLREVMSSPVITVSPGTRVKEVAGLLVEHGISAVPVVDGGELVGIVSEADLVPLDAVPDVRAHLAPVPEPTPHAARTAGEVMTTEVLALPEDADVAEAARLLLDRGFRSVPVVRGRQVTGIVARRDLLKAIARRDADIARDLRGLLAEELGPDQGVQVEVVDGVVTVSGVADPGTRRLATLLTRTVPGVLEVHAAPPDQPPEEMR